MSRSDVKIDPTLHSEIRQFEANVHHHRFEDTMMMKSPGGAAIVVNAGLSAGGT
ncbi:MAG: hypothetical protein PUE54_00845 [Bacteroidales bacterium]|nr:hypothetical protein [Bacteroidales bacterium]